LPATLPPHFQKILRQRLQRLQRLQRGCKTYQFRDEVALLWFQRRGLSA
jgi:hypothetical protein